MGSGGSLFKPILRRWRKIIGNTADFIMDPFIDVWDKFWDLENAGLYCCGFFFIFGLIVLAYLVFVLTVILTEFFIFLFIGLLIGLSFTLFGIWPAFICTVGITGIVIIRIPKNIFQHFLITYRTVVISRSLKLLSFFLIPIIHLLVPVATFLVCIVAFPPVCALTSFAGHPLKPWKWIKINHQLAWKKFATQVDQFAENYGHWSGIGISCNYIHLYLYKLISFRYSRELEWKSFWSDV